MKQFPKWLGPYLAVLTIGGTFFAGQKIRDRIDLGGSSKINGRQGLVPDNLVASRTQDNELTPAEYFKQLVRLVKDQYVEPVKEDMPLASGAVRGMVASLGDTKSIYLDAEEFRAFQASKVGTYEGIGVELALLSQGAVDQISQAALQPTGESGPEEALALSQRIPRLTVVGLTKNGSAAKAGVKLGDTVYAVEGHWVVSSDLLDEFGAARKDFAAKKITAFDLNTIRKRLKAQTERAYLPLKAKKTLVVGTKGSVEVEWRRGKEAFKTNLSRGISNVTTREELGLRFVPGASETLKTALKANPSLSIDLRNNSNGDFSEVKKCLSVIGGAGTYGFIRGQKSPVGTALKLDGKGSAKGIKLLVDESTRGAAELFALALSAKGLGKLEGGKMSGERLIVQTTGLPDGTGYTLVTGEYSVNQFPNKSVATKKTPVVKK